MTDHDLTGKAVEAVKVLIMLERAHPGASFVTSVCSIRIVRACGDEVTVRIKEADLDGSC